MSVSDGDSIEVKKLSSFSLEQTLHADRANPLI